MEIRTPRLLLRQWRDEDREPYAALAAGYTQWGLEEIEVTALRQAAPPSDGAA